MTCKFELTCYAVAAYVAYVILFGIYKHFIRAGKNVTKYGKWAVITGATDGIGKAYAEALAKKGLNILLISRTASKLLQTSEELRTKYPKCETKTLAIDFSHFDLAAQGQVRALVDELDVGILVNNVGQSYAYPQYFHELDEMAVKQLIELNVTSTTVMTSIVLPGMLERKRGAIICISSAAAQFTNPLLTQYSAAKAYIDKFAQGLHAEYSSRGIDVQVQIPLYVTTKLAKIRRASLTVPTPAAYVRSALQFVGHESLVSPYWTHAAQLYVMSWIPDAILSKVITSMHRGIRSKALKKKETENKQQ